MRLSKKAAGLSQGFVIIAEGKLSAREPLPLSVTVCQCLGEGKLLLHHYDVPLRQPEAGPGRLSRGWA